MIHRPVAVVTGASRGIGRSAAIGLAKTGYSIVLISRNENKLKEVADEIKMINGRNGSVPMVFIADINRTEVIPGCIKSIIARFGRIDVLVNNAGIYIEGTSDISLEGFRSMIETNLTAQFAFIKEIVPVMRKQQSGYIFNIASRAGKIGFSDSGGYSASKFGLVGLSQSLHRELSKEGISVTAICPGWVDTDMAYEAGTHLEGNEMIQPEDISKTILFLLSISKGCRIREIILEPAKNIS